MHVNITLFTFSYLLFLQVVLFDHHFHCLPHYLLLGIYFLQMISTCLKKKKKHDTHDDTLI